MPKPLSVSREQILKFLYSVFITETPKHEIIKKLKTATEKSLNESQKQFIIELLNNKSEYIEVIQNKLSIKWEFNRLPILEQIILLISTQEIKKNLNFYKVYINEAIHLAKLYTDEKSYKYINAVLNEIYISFVKKLTK